MAKGRINTYLRRGLERLPANTQTMLKGLISYIPGVYRYVDDTRSASAEFCYSVWLRHMVLAEKHGLDTEPKVFLELGPGSSLGVGLCSLLAGSRVHYALDAIPFAQLDQNLAVLEKLVDLFDKRAEIPHGDFFATEVNPALSSYAFPHHILTGERLRNNLTTERIGAIRNALITALSGQTHVDGSSGIDIRYHAPWHDRHVIPRHGVDMILSNTVLQCVEDLPAVYAAFAYWLKPGGAMSHNIDYSSYGATREWNGHWACSPLEWRLMKGKRLYLLNRQPHSAHVALTMKNRFRIVADVCTTTREGIQRNQLSDDFRWLSEKDLHTSGALIQSVRTD